MTVYHIIRYHAEDCVPLCMSPHSALKPKVRDESAFEVQLFEISTHDDYLSTKMQAIAHELKSRERRAQ